MGSLILSDLYACASATVYSYPRTLFSTNTINYTDTEVASESVCINPLRPNSVQNQFSPNDIHRLSKAKSTRINKMILKRKIFDLLSNSLN